MKNYAIILAGGDGKRLGSKIPKCFIKVNGKELYKYSLETFLSISKFKKIVLVVPKGYVNKVDIEDKRLMVVEGGNDRNKSFENGLSPLLEKAKSLDKVLIHDAARPFVLKEDILKLIKSNLDYGTLAYIGPKNNSDYHINGYNIQTPQFTRIWLYVSLDKKDPKGKDLISYFRLEPSKYNFIISSNKEKNLKITYKSDLKKIL